VIRTVDGNTLNKQLRTATRGGLPALVLGYVLTTPHQNVMCYKMLQRLRALTGHLGWPKPGLGNFNPQ